MRTLYNLESICVHCMQPSTSLLHRVVPKSAMIDPVLADWQRWEIFPRYQCIAASFVILK